MDSPKSRQHKEKRVSYRRREHKNKKFYNSKAWRDTREAYLRKYEQRLFDECIRDRKWKGVDLTDKQATYLSALTYLPCETCLKHYAAEAYKKVQEGKELDHIIPVNPENALLPNTETEFGVMNTCGDPYSFDNLQLLCRRHHAKKSQRER